ncbi:SNF2 family N-terminal domain-containing protein [Mrakia frigida]|uniref:DNA-dependent ATPase FUN30 n=1 Tax=Mrakia frigida TaxID=29902 RepID=UPI003FCBFAEA
MSERADALAKLKAARANRAAPKPVEKAPSKSTSTLLSHSKPSTSASRPIPKVLVPSSSSPVAHTSRPAKSSSSSSSSSIATTSKYFRSTAPAAAADEDGDPIPRFGMKPPPTTSSSSFTTFRPPLPPSGSSRSSSVATATGDDHQAPPRKRPDINSRSASPASFGAGLSRNSSSAGLSVTGMGLESSSAAVVPIDLDSDNSGDSLFDDKPSSSSSRPPPPPRGVADSPMSIASNSDVEMISHSSTASSSARIANNSASITRFANKFGGLSLLKVTRVLTENDFDALKSERVLRKMEQDKMGTTARSASSSKPLVVQPPPKNKSSHQPIPESPLAQSQSQRKGGGEHSAIYANRKSLGGGGDATPKSERRQQKKEKTTEKKSKKDESGSEEDDGSDESGGDYGTGGKRGMAKWERDEEKEERDALDWFNTCEHQALLDITSTSLILPFLSLSRKLTLLSFFRRPSIVACSALQATTVLSARPFESVDDLRSKFQKKRGISQKIFDDYIEIMQGYHKVDAVLKGCELVGEELERAMSVFTSADARKGGKGKGKEETAVDLVAVELKDVEALMETEVDPERKKALRGYIKKQPELLAEGVVLKDYQLLGVNWLNLLYSRGLSCILADEMGLGKTIQVISFLAHLSEKGEVGPHLIIVPSSTLENWAREFERFCPDIEVQTYYGSQTERAELGYQLVRDENVEVVLTTYTIASGTNKDDKKFFRKMGFQTAVFDEGHQLKNYQSARYKSLMALDVKFRLLLTGTPLQNNLQELVSVLNFILPDYFEDAEDALRAIFKVSTSSHANLLSKQRVSRAQKMMKPFVLRRRKDQVLKELPKKTVRTDWCSLTTSQAKIYSDQEAWSAKTLRSLALEADKNKKKDKSKKRGRDDLEIDNGPQVAKKVGDSGSNVLMNLRKAASHPLLFRTHYTDALLRVVAKDIMKEPEHMTGDYNLIIEDMEIMSDSELHALCKTYKSTRKHILPPSAFLDCGKVDALRKILDDCLSSGKRLLLFSMFTQILDILKTVLDHLGVKWVILTGMTKVDERQSLVDEFTNDSEIKVFLLSTLAGGMGINLTAASVVVVYDIGFNPHNEKQAADRAHRLGQTKEVEIITLLSKGTVDEDINDLALSKLRLDDAVAGRTGAAEDEDQETEGKMKASLLTTLRNKLDKKSANGTSGGGDVVMEEVVKEEEEEILEKEVKKEVKDEKEEEKKFVKEEKKAASAGAGKGKKGEVKKGESEESSEEEPTQMDVV